MEVEKAESQIEKSCGLFCFVHMYRLGSEQCCKKECLEVWGELQQKKAEIKKYEYVLSRCVLLYKFCHIFFCMQFEFKTLL